ncbi:RagB/SusD family nutrient uptake outer membrane protein [Chitinophaga defluvii]|uniref:RagB/SusD family nutrient uptake outer membrane protein n=1 Tax=Chitinophaga defluvii TaxID=3163343 RepID=A0ABV2T2D9_9BACT
MKFNNINIGLLSLALALLTVSCQKDLDRKPYYDVTTASVFTDFKNYKNVLAKCYGGLALTGQVTGDGNADIGGVDVGYVRGFWQMQELSTDEARVAWNDQYLLPMHGMDWTSQNLLLGAMYNRIFLQVMYCNEFLRQTTDGKLSENGISGENAATTKIYRAEMRFLRAFSYWHAIDMFGNVPFVTENDPVGAFFPKQTSRKELFAYVESELKAIEADLMAPRTNEYPRADKAAAWMLLAKLYLNAEVYTGTPRYTDAITYCNKIIEAGYTLEPRFQNLFLADNDKLKNEIIFTIAYDGQKMKTYNGTTFLIHAAVGGNMDATKDFGIDGGWYGLRTTKNIVHLFTDITGQTDSRAMFHSSGQNLEMNSIANFADGYPVTKWRNITSTGAGGSDKLFVDTDFPVFRLGDVYLMYAEAVLRGGTGGSSATALEYINKLRQRAYGNTSGNITAGQLTLDFMLDERGRELMWEAQRRTDLIRFGKYTGSNYVWPWKGNVKEGKGVEAYRTLFPLPAADMIANPNLKQNEGYN